MGITIKGPNFHHEDENPRGHYVDFRDAIKSPNYREQLLSNARRDAETFRAKYSTLEEVLPIIQAIDSIAG